jgi:hypothetical protein
MKGQFMKEIKYKELTISEVEELLWMLEQLKETK